MADETLLPALAADGDADEDQLCQFLQGQSRVLEKREMTQMRQNAILQQKLETAKQELKQMEQARTQRQQERQQARMQRQQEREVAQQQPSTEASSVENTSSHDEEAAAAALEADLQQRLQQSSRRQAQLERDAQDARGRCRKLEVDLNFWRRCGQELLAPSDSSLGTEPSADSAERHAAQLEASKESAAQFKARSLQLATQVSALRDRSEELQSRLGEVDRIAETAQLQEAQLTTRNEGLVAAAARAESAAVEAAAELSREKQREQELHSEAAQFHARLAEEQSRNSELVGGASGSTAASSSAGTAAATTGSSDLSYLRKKMEERGKELASLRAESTRLQGALRRHAGLEGGYRASDHGGAGSEVVEGACCGPFDDAASRIVMLLFKSILVRRFFCVHLAVLYSWLLFLLWWLSHE